jgi:hypothetical protein
MFELSALMLPSPRRYATSVSTQSLDATGNVTAVPTGDAPADPNPTYGVTSTVPTGRCGPYGCASRGELRIGGGRGASRWSP